MSQLTAVSPSQVTPYHCYTKTSDDTEKPGVVDRIMTYLSTCQGVSDVLDGLSYGAQCLSYLPLGKRQIKCISKLGEGTSLASSSIWIVDVVTDGRVLIASVPPMMRALYKGSIGKIVKEVRNLTYNTLALGGDVFEVAKFAFVCLGRALSPLALGVGSAVWLCVDSADLVDEVKTVCHNRQEMKLTKSKNMRRHFKACNQETYLKGVRTIAAIAMDALGLVALFFVAVQAASVTPLLFLGLSIVFLAMSVSIYFFHEQKKDVLSLPHKPLKRLT